MTMGFKVDDKSLFDKLGVGRTVEFEFVQTDRGYRVTAVR
jgi:Cu(I)/Ag(I) efflux system protein CusF